MHARNSFILQTVVVMFMRIVKARQGLWHCCWSYFRAFALLMPISELQEKAHCSTGVRQHIPCSVEKQNMAEKKRLFHKQPDKRTCYKKSVNRLTQKCASIKEPHTAGLQKRFSLSWALIRNEYKNHMHTPCRDALFKKRIKIEKLDFNSSHIWVSVLFTRLGKFMDSVC